MGPYTLIPVQTSPVRLSLSSIGAIAALELTIRSKNINDDILVVRNLTSVCSSFFP